MTTQEFSNTFDTLLNSYNSQAQFGEQTSKTDLVLDEYEKSVLLTQAQDIIVKQYFDKNNNLGQGIDDSNRRQMDFSSLITVAKLSPVPPTVTIYQSGTHTPETQTIIDSKNLVFTTFGSGSIIPITRIIVGRYHLVTNDAGLNYTISDLKYLDNDDTIKTESSAVVTGLKTYTATSLGIGFEKQYTYDDRGILYQIPNKVLLILNEQIKGVQILNDQIKGVQNKVIKNYVVVPIHYKEYDRQMYKPYTQPLKKQCWRLFQNNGSETLNELIPIDGVSILSYTMRYIRRPRPIVLTKLSSEGQEPLNIDGVTDVTECELNPIIHMDILNKAMEIAISTRLHVPQQQYNANPNNNR